MKPVNRKIIVSLEADYDKVWQNYMLASHQKHNFDIHTIGSVLVGSKKEIERKVKCTQ